MRGKCFYCDYYHNHPQFLLSLTLSLFFHLERCVRKPSIRKMDPSQVDVPPLKDLTIDNITDNVKLINSQCPDPRLKYLLERLVQHLHDYARETRLSHNEWMTGIQFLTSVGQICTDVRQVCWAIAYCNVYLEFDGHAS